MVLAYKLEWFLKMYIIPLNPNSTCSHATFFSRVSNDPLHSFQWWKSHALSWRCAALCKAHCHQALHWYNMHRGSAFSSGPQKVQARSHDCWNSIAIWWDNSRMQQEGKGIQMDAQIQPNLLVFYIQKTARKTRILSLLSNLRSPVSSVPSTPQRPNTPKAWAAAAGGTVKELQRASCQVHSYSC